MFSTHAYLVNNGDRWRNKKQFRKRKRKKTEPPKKINNNKQNKTYMMKNLKNLKFEMKHTL